MLTTVFGTDRLPVRLSRPSPVPPYEQLRAQLTVMVAAGRLEPSVRLPAIRDLAEQLDLAPGTVARAYRCLVDDGTAVTRGRAGTFVVDEPRVAESLADRRRKLRQAADEYVGRCLRLGVDDRAAVDAVEGAFGREIPADDRSVGRVPAPARDDYGPQP